ncbi:MAG: carbonate dehydratase [Candidatus Cloacimonetes bacterium]|nr:carbonate dehydratase [Candidatus Cloacimonadota bacterium]
MNGNQRFIESIPIGNVLNESEKNNLIDGQNPFAVVLTCSDSRVAPEIYFDQRHGDIFVVRNAGNICDSIAYGSIEYAVEHLRAPLLLVVGHSHCGAVSGAFDNAQLGGNIQKILDIIVDHIESSENLEEAIFKNIYKVVENIKKNESIVKHETMVIGAYYDLVTGSVNFFIE